ncbi:spermatogenesis-associated protein 1 [Pholidichthys leucotaenia]
MELSCESVRCAEDRRPSSCKFVELHVLCVPCDQWNDKLNKVPVEATESFISAGFIRVYPDITLKMLRRELGVLLGTESSFSFLKCVGRSLALVKGRQERDLKVKTFAPPYTAQPELYLLPTVENDSSVFSQSVTPDTSSSSSDHHIYYHPPKAGSLPTGTKEPVKFPHIPQSSQQAPLTPQEEEKEEEEEEDNDDQRYSSTDEGGQNDKEAPSSIRSSGKNQKAQQLVSQNKALQLNWEADSVRLKEFQHKEENVRKKKPCPRVNRGARNSGASESFEDRDSGFDHTDRAGKSKAVLTLKTTRKMLSAGETENAAVLSQPAQCTSPCSDVVLVTKKTAVLFHRNREELIEEIKSVREERKQLERTRQELLRKGKDLLAQNRHRRNKARDSWKKKYFETKKATASLEDNLRNLRQELETFYNKLLHQLQARDRGKPRRQGKSSAKNEVIIQIMTESHEIDNLKRKVEDAKMKLIKEIKLREQAATEVRALKAELIQKKSQSSHPGLMGNAIWGGEQAQSSSL